MRGAPVLRACFKGWRSATGVADIMRVFLKKRSGPNDADFISREVSNEEIPYKGTEATIADLKQHIFAKYNDGQIRDTKGIHVLNLPPEEYDSYYHEKQLQKAFGLTEQLSNLGHGLGLSADCPIVWMAFRFPARTWL